MLRIEHLTKKYGDKKAVDDLSLHIQKGEIYGFIGHNGAGKTTTIKSCCGILNFDEGEIYVDGVSVKEKPLECKRKIAYIPDNPDLYEFMTGIKYLNFIADIFGISQSDRQARISKYAEMFEIKNALAQTIDGYSHGMKQKLAIVSALIHNPKLIIMDEPTASLTHQEVEGLLHVVRQLRERGICIVFVSHRLEEVMAVSDRISVLKDGNLVGTLPAAEVTTRRLGFLMTGQEFDFQVRDLWQGQGSTPVLEVRNLSRKGEYHNVSLKVEAGEVVSIVGLLGAGRTELCLSLFGMTRPDSGEILINGQPVRLRSNQDAIRHGIGYVSEDRMSRGLVMSQSIENNIISTVFHKVKGACGLLSDSKAQQLVARMVNALTIKAPDTHLPVNTLSGGNAQRVSIAKWLAISPKLLILDSPTVGVDIANKAGIYHIISDLAAHGIAVLMICDEIEEAWYQSHRILVMKQGELTHSFLPDSSTQQQIAEVVNG